MNGVGQAKLQIEDRHQLPARWPVLAPLVLLGLALLLRLLDLFVLHLDERLGEISLSKSLGFALVVGYTWWVGQGVTAIGLHSRNLGLALASGAGLPPAVPQDLAITDSFAAHQRVLHCH